MKKNIKIKFEMDSDFDEELSKAPIDHKLNDLVDKIKKEENYKIVDEQALEYNKSWSEIGNQIVGAEENYSNSQKERDYQTTIWNNLSKGLAFL